MRMSTLGRSVHCSRDSPCALRALQTPPVYATVMFMAKPYDHLLKPKARAVLSVQLVEH